MLATTTDADRQARTRNRCNGEGYESVALIPLRIGDQRLGLLQLNDHQKGRFSLETILLWERLADYLAVALSKFRAEEALRESEARLRQAAEFDEAALKSLGEGLYTVDTQGLVTSMNPSAEELFGWSFAELRGKKMHDLTHHHYRDGRPFPSSECAGFQVLTTGRPLKNHEDAFIRKDGTFFDVNYSIAPMRDTDGQITGLVVVFSDVTVMKQAEEALRESEATVPRAGRRNSAVGLDGESGRRDLLVQPALVSIHRNHARADGRLGLAVGTRSERTPQSAGTLEALYRYRRSFRHGVPVAGSGWRLPPLPDARNALARHARTSGALVRHQHRHQRAATRGSRAASAG